VIPFATKNALVINAETTLTSMIKGKKQGKLCWKKIPTHLPINFSLLEVNNQN
jgi:hypothetical protein